MPTRHESIETTMRYYVGRNAQNTAKTLWEAHKLAGSSNTFGTEQQNHRPRTKKALPKSKTRQGLRSSGGGIRTPDTRIMIQRVTTENAKEIANSEDSAAVGAAVDLENALIDPDLQSIIDHWSELPEALKAGIVAMVRATERK